MKNNIHYSPITLKELDNIDSYITNKLLNPEAAKNTINGIQNKINSILLSPNGFPELIFENGLKSGYHYVIYKSYIIFYHTEMDDIFIDRIFHTKQNYLSILFPNLND